MMTILLKDIQDGVVIEFSPDQTNTNVINIAVTAISATASVVALYALLKQKNLAFDSYYIVSMTCADLGFSMLDTIIASTNAYYGGWGAGQSGCILNAILLIVLLGSSITSIFCMNLHKYLSIIFQIQLEKKHVYSLIIVGYALPISVGLLLLKSPDTLVSLQSSYGYCFIAVNQSDPWDVALSAMVILVILGTIVFLIYTHIAIILAYKRMKLAIASPEKYIKFRDSVLPVLDTERLRKEKLLIKKSIAISSIFSLNWVVFLTKLFYELASKNQSPLHLDMAVELIGVLTPIVNVFILYYYDFKFKRNVRELLRLENFEQLLPARFKKSTHSSTPRVQNCAVKDASPNCIIVNMDIQRNAVSPNTPTILHGGSSPPHPLDTVKITREK